MSDTKSPDGVQLFCDHHQHDGLIDELTQDYGCASREELHQLLIGALRWASKYKVSFGNETSCEGVESITLQTGTEIDKYAGRRLVSIRTQGDNYKCHIYRRLMKAAMALLAMSHPILRRGAEAPVPEWDVDPIRHYYDFGNKAFED